MFNWIRSLFATRDPPPAQALVMVPDWRESYAQYCEEKQAYWSKHPIALSERKGFILDQLKKAIDKPDPGLAHELIEVATTSNDENTVPILNEMLIMKGHRRHQAIIRAIQLCASATSIPYLRKSFEEDLEHIVECSHSEPAVVAKWFSHAFRHIDTPEAIASIKHYTTHPDSGVREEMLYRLSKIERLS